MKAFVYRRYGGPDVVELAEVPKPVPRDNEVLVRIHATTVTSGDWRVRTLHVPTGLGLVARLAIGFTRPRQPIMGSEMAGTIESVGKHVTRFRVGDEVFGFPGGAMGCHAQYRTMPEDGRIARKPANLSFEEAASLPFGASTSLHYLRKAKIKAGEAVLVIGASGGVGSAMVQLAKHFGAQVTGVTSTNNLALVASLGADRVIDYTREDFTARGETYDIVVDTVGKTPVARCMRILKDKGRLLAVAAGLPEMLASVWAPLTGSRRVIAGPAEERAGDIPEIAALAEAGALKPVIDRRYRFAQMPEAHAYVETGRKRGSVVVSVEHA
ncbi:NAD(P)-dependent alcohol dehydrogenase [Reyranella sp. MMS21-HV4-11]|uniref:NAD(P)-dependent alcohol dehydrogenase n=1 Tax=Reyranella humidisoli TaxID=2849149 RepID=A0ABS6IIJ9_9HYPH|nr:NAD(P)-dependent alcohol dehydrogenase [Reyranella sp. MMS21-HV4-11]MBU8873108.1 NAD(P)-dependent alcohol dehydrogenase [Reyranella sp. MMS21-HV4-11]